MDILTHTVSGLAIGSVAGAYCKKSKWRALFLGGLGGAIPDIDAISLWSKFDMTFGNALALTHSGADIYFGKYWYSHHAITHSLVFAIVLALLVFIANRKNIDKKILAMSFLGAYVLHLMEDMPTPGSTWDGVAFLWPSTSYVGGSGHIWWWNNYDIFLIAFGIFAMNLLFMTFTKWRKLPTYLLILGLISGVFQIFTRGYDFDYEGHSTNFSEKEIMSKEIQAKLLPKPVYDFMVALDNKVPLNF